MIDVDEAPPDDPSVEARLSPSGPAPARPRPSRTKLVLTIVPIIGLIICSNVGDALTTTWAEEHPLALIALNSRNRILVLTTNQLDALSYYVVGTVRLLLSDPLFFLLGRWYGDTAIEWVEKRSPTYGDLIRRAERGFGKAAYALVLIAPNQWICLLAGAAGMSVVAFFTLNIIGTLGRLYLIRVLGETFEAPIDAVLGFFRDYRIPLFVLSVVLVVVFAWNEGRRGRGDIGTIQELEHEIEQADDD
jgi:membrane protein DedA with SNARE-associated domain